MSDYVRGLRAKIGNDYLLLPTVAARIRDADGRFLLVQHVEGRWQLPGGAVDPDAERLLARQQVPARVRPDRRLASRLVPRQRHPEHPPSRRPTGHGTAFRQESSPSA